MKEFKLLPCSYEVEATILGSILSDSKFLNDVLEIIDTNDFYKESHKIIYSIFLDLFSQNIKIDLITVAEALRKIDSLKQCGGITYLSQMTESVLRTNDIKAYAEIIKEKSNKRKIIKIANELLEKGYNAKLNSKEIISDVEENLCSLVLNTEDRMCNIDLVMDTTLRLLENNYKNGGGITGTSYGFNEIDRVTSGLQKQDLIIIAARPSMGKTTLAVNIGNYVAKTKQVAIFSLEMSKEQLVQKKLSATALVEYEKIRSGKLDGKEWDKIASASGHIASLKLRIDDTAAQSVNIVKAKCKKLKAQSGLDLIIIDYLQLMQGNGEKNREQEISTISRGLKAIAKELNITVIALSQLSRAPEQRSDHRPMLSDLRESGSIEQDADVVMFLYRDEYYNNETEDKNIAECIIGKQRNGRVGTIKLAWLGQYQMFANLDVIHSGR
ncbi:replicative DNA helicase [Clostridium estertheticum]|uniref:Replicative DNA helicase n=1 Tax=Clostridium estertheticum TaxID=238834 RepID=A0A5N7J307_9CLOT|nr:replicative DNA helicase [Clostridium estertheticum]MPQ32466.1 replicative DNA helicase [Clostridium estertheticum]MPQ63125.1 replicative DNA helicase [Clostridium estertheticum]